MRFILFLLVGCTLQLQQQQPRASALRPFPATCTAEPVAKGKTLITVVGDSITFGFNCKTWQGGYVKVLQDILGTDKYDVRDCGVDGTDAVSSWREWQTVNDVQNQNHRNTISSATIIIYI